MQNNLPFKNIFAIVNPKSGNGFALKHWSIIKTLIEQEIGCFEFAFTQGPGHATSLASDACYQSRDLVISIGGDGTNNEIVNGLMACRPNTSTPTLAFIPCGCGCDLAKNFRIGRRIKGAIEKIAQGTIDKIDVFKVIHTDSEGEKVARFGLNITSFGIGGLVDRLANASTKKLGGRVSFVISILKALSQYKNQQVRVSFDNGNLEEMVINNVVIANSRYFGGGLLIAPEAEIDDGLFDVVILGDLSKFEVILNWPKAYYGKHLSHPKVHHLRSKTIFAEPMNPRDEILIDLDGESSGRLPATFEIIPKVLPVLF